MPERSVLASGEDNSEAGGSINRIDPEAYLLYENEDVFHFELLISAGNAETSFFSCVEWRAPATIKEMLALFGCFLFFAEPSVSQNAAMD